MGAIMLDTSRTIDLDSVRMGADWDHGGLEVANGGQRFVLPFYAPRSERVMLVSGLADVLTVRLCFEYDQPDGPDALPRHVAEALANRVLDLWFAHRFNSAYDLLMLVCERWTITVAGMDPWAKAES